MPTKVTEGDIVKSIGIHENGSQGQKMLVEQCKGIVKLAAF